MSEPTGRPCEFTMTVCNAHGLSRSLSFNTRVVISRLALWRDGLGVRTHTPQSATWSGAVVTSQVWRVIPEPEYQRELGCRELSTRTASTLDWPAVRRYGVRS